MRRSESISGRLEEKPLRRGPVAQFACKVIASMLPHAMRRRRNTASRMHGGKRPANLIDVRRLINYSAASLVQRERDAIAAAAAAAAAAFQGRTLSVSNAAYARGRLVVVQRAAAAAQ
jgi:hypothetical protein